MKKVTSGWLLHQLTHEQRVKLCRENSVKFRDGSWRLCDIVSGVMKGRFTIGSFITSERAKAALTKLNHQLL